MGDTVVTYLGVLNLAGALLQVRELFAHGVRRHVCGDEPLQKARGGHGRRAPPAARGWRAGPTHAAVQRATRQRADVRPSRRL